MQVDAVPKEARPRLLPLADKLRELCTFEDVFWISAVHGEWQAGPPGRCRTGCGSGSSHPALICVPAGGGTLPADSVICKPVGVHSHRPRCRAWGA